MKKRFPYHILCLMLSILLLTVALPRALALGGDNPAGETIDELPQGDSLTNNYGTVTNNFGSISVNMGTGIVTNNFGTVTLNSGNVVNNYGTVSGGEGSITNQYYRVTFTGAEHVTVTGCTEIDGVYYVHKNKSIYFTANLGYQIDSIETTASKNSGHNYSVLADNTGFAITTSRATRDVSFVSQIDAPYPPEDVYVRIMASSGGGTAVPVTADAAGNAIGDANGVFALEPENDYKRIIQLFTHTTDLAEITYSMQEGKLSSGQFTPVAEGGVIQIYDKNYIVTYSGPTAMNSRCTVVTFDRSGGMGGTESLCPKNNAPCPSITPPTKEGYVFQGYFSDDADQIQVFNASGNPINLATVYIGETGNWIYTQAKEETLIAHWTPCEYTITYKDKDNETFSGTHGTNAPTKHTYGTETALVEPTKTGYAFGGWFTTSDCTGTALTALPADGYLADINLYAKWTPCEYTITYMDKGNATFSGTHGANPPQTHTYDTETALVEPTKTGYIFGGWFTTSDCTGTALTVLSEDAITADTTLYVKWVDVAATVTVNGVTTQYASFSDAWDFAVDIADSTLKLFNDVTADNNAPESWPITVGSSSNITLDLNGHTINRGLTTAADNGGVIAVEGTFTLSDTHGGGVITGGNTTGNGGGVCISNGATVSLLGGAITANNAEGHGGGVYMPSDVTIGGALSVTDNTSGERADNLYLEGSVAIQVTFGFTGSIGVSTDVPPTAGNPITISTATTTDYSSHFTADVPEQNVFTESNMLKLRIAPTTAVTLDIQGGVSSSTQCTAVLGRALGDVAAYPAPAMPTRDNYTFAGFYSAVTGGELIIDKNGAFVQSATGYTDANAHWASEAVTLTLYAKWTPCEYTITYMDKGNATFSGTHGANPPQTHTYDTETALVEPTKTGYIFGGWFTTSDCTGTALTVLSEDAITADTTLYAKWTAKVFAINYFDKNHTTFSGVHRSNYPATHTYGTATNLVSPTKSGYYFGGWYAASDCTGTALTVLPADGYLENIDLYAKWTPREYTITYMDKGSESFSGTHGANAPKTHTYNTATALVEPTKTGYAFGGWFTASDCTGTAITVLPAYGYSANIILYAKWTALDAGLTSVKLNGANAQLSGNTITVILPEGSTLPTDASAIEILAEGATFTDPVTADNGATWTFSVTSPNGEKKDYTLKVVVQEPAPILTEPVEEEEKSGLPLWPFLLGAGVLVAVGGVWYYVYRRKRNEN